MEKLIAWALTTLVSAFVGSYLAGYLKKKGENLATKEDVGALIDQTRQLTQTTKEIEAKIDDQMWNRQRHWELKKETLIEVVKTIAKAEYSLKHAIVSLNAVVGEGGFKSQLARDTFSHELDACIDYVVALDGLRLLMALITDTQSLTTFTDMKEAYNKTVLCLDVKDFNMRGAKYHYEEFAKLVVSFHTAARIEIGIPLSDPNKMGLATSQSTQSSAAQDPAQK
jgi:hypothetical protein